jgi:hypothetical protein
LTSSSERNANSNNETNAKNGFEIYVLVELDDVTALLPLNLYSAKQQATITCPNLRLEVRYLPTYLDLLVNFSPMVVRVPSLSREFDSGRDPLQIKDCTFHLHFMYGPPPSVTNYAEQYSVEIREVSGHVQLSQITALTAWFSNFFFHLSNKDNDISEELASDSLPLYTTLLVRVHELGLHLWAPSYRSVTQVLLPAGFHLSSHTLISPAAHSTMTIRIPSLAIHILVPTHDNSGRSMWAETGNMQLSLLVNIYDKFPHGTEDATFQWMFLRQNDEPTKRLAFLWPSMTHTKYKAYINDSVSHANGPHGNVPLLVLPPSTSGSLDSKPSSTTPRGNSVEEDGRNKKRVSASNNTSTTTTTTTTTTSNNNTVVDAKKIKSGGGGKPTGSGDAILFVSPSLRSSQPSPAVKKKRDLVGSRYARTLI